jgi:Leucine-rich repeat (LRR) protein
VLVRLRSSLTRQAAVPHGMKDLLQHIPVSVAELRGAWTLASLDSVLATMPELLTLSITEGALTAVPPPQVWSGLTRLASLNLGYNQISVWDPDALVPLNGTLEALSMVQNKLRKITPETFRATQMLSTLDLSDNYLEVLPTGMLKHTPRLSTLTIASNNLITLEPLCKWSLVGGRRGGGVSQKADDRMWPSDFGVTFSIGRRHL